MGCVNSTSPSNLKKYLRPLLRVAFRHFLPIVDDTNLSGVSTHYGLNAVERNRSEST